MKKILIVLLSSATILSAQVAIKAPANVSSALDTIAAPAPIANTLTVKTGTFRVDTYENDKLASRSYYKNGSCVKYITYNSETNKPEIDVEHLYEKSGKLKRSRIIRGGGLIDAELGDKSRRDLVFQRDYLRSKEIGFPLADIVAVEVNDLFAVLSIADNYSDFQTETGVNGNRKVIKFTGFNKTNRFAHSPIALLTAGSDFIKIKDYELTSENGLPQRELYRIPDGEITREYAYKNERLTGVVHRFIDLQNRSTVINKRFEYHKLK